MKIIFKSIICSILFLILFNSCCKEEKLSLPEITTSGQNTFGCYVDGKLFVHAPGSGIFGGRSIDGAYHEEINTLSVFSYAKNDLLISVIDSIAEVGKTYEISDALYIDYDTRYHLCKDMPSEIHLLRLDKENGIASGIFSFKAKNPESGEIKTITEGRFDIKILYESMEDYKE